MFIDPLIFINFLSLMKIFDIFCLLIPAVKGFAIHIYRNEKDCSGYLVIPITFLKSNKIIGITVNDELYNAYYIRDEIKSEVVKSNYFLNNARINLEYTALYKITNFSYFPQDVVRLYVNNSGWLFQKPQQFRPVQIFYHYKDTSELEQAYANLKRCIYNLRTLKENIRKPTYLIEKYVEFNEDLTTFDEIMKLHEEGNRLNNLITEKIDMIKILLIKNRNYLETDFLPEHEEHAIKDANEMNNILMQIYEDVKHYEIQYNSIKDIIFPKKNEDESKVIPNNEKFKIEKEFWIVSSLIITIYLAIIIVVEKVYSKKR